MFQQSGGLGWLNLNPKSTFKISNNLLVDTTAQQFAALQTVALDSKIHCWLWHCSDHSCLTSPQHIYILSVLLMFWKKAAFVSALTLWASIWMQWLVHVRVFQSLSLDSVKVRKFFGLLWKLCIFFISSYCICKVSLVSSWISVFILSPIATGCI